MFDHPTATAPTRGDQHTALKPGAQKLPRRAAEHAVADGHQHVPCGWYESILICDYRLCGWEGGFLEAVPAPGRGSRQHYLVGRSENTEA